MEVAFFLLMAAIPWSVLAVTLEHVMHWLMVIGGGAAVVFLCALVLWRMADYKPYRGKVGNDRSDRPWERF